MKIALFGAQGVGKTTLSRALLEEFPGSYIVRETVRECPYPCDQQADFKTEWWVLSHSILAEKEAQENHSGQLIVTDRSLLDIAIYTKLIQETGDGRITNRQRGMIETVIRDWLIESPCELMFYLSVNSKVWQTRDLEDGFRSTDLGWYLRLAEEFESAIKRFEVEQHSKLHRIENNGTFGDMMAQVCSAIRSHNENKRLSQPRSA